MSDKKLLKGSEEYDIAAEIARLLDLRGRWFQTRKVREEQAQILRGIGVYLKR